MRPIYFVLALALAAVLSFAALPVSAQQPEIVDSQVTTQSAGHGLAAALDSLKQTATPLWVGYPIPVQEHLQSSWGSSGTTYLEAAERSGYTMGNGPAVQPDHAILLFRLLNGKVDDLRISDSEHRIDAGGLRFVWLPNITPEDSVTTLMTLALAQGSTLKHGSVAFLISLHRSSATTPALIALAAASNELSLRGEAAFWLANQRGKEGLEALKRFAREDSDARFREKLTFDLTLSKEPAARDELIRMAHEDASPRVRQQAQFWMAMRGGKLVAASLRQSADHDGDADSRRQAVFALSRLPGEQAVTELSRVADTSQYPEVRKQAIFWLGQSQDPRALDYLTKLLNSSAR